MKVACKSKKSLVVEFFFRTEPFSLALLSFTPISQQRLVGEFRDGAHLKRLFKTKILSCHGSL